MQNEEPLLVCAEGFVRLHRDSIAMYDGLNGWFEKTGIRCNGRCLYQKRDNPKTVMWWANLAGKMSWCIGPRKDDMTVNAAVWAKCANMGVHPAQKTATWHVFCYENRVWLKQHQAKVTAEEYTTCVICLEETPNHVLIPCGHIACCQNCVKHINKIFRCPLCRKTIKGVYQIFPL